MKLKTICHKEKLSPSYQIFILIISIYSLLLIAAETMLRPKGGIRDIFDLSDYIVCVIFFIDFVIVLYNAKYKLRYLYTWGWLDLLSCIPAIDAFRLWRVARIIRIIRLFRILRSARIIGRAIAGRKIQNLFLSMILIVFTLVITSSILVLNFEAATNGPIKSPMDAIWWSMSTLTTVGYGDVYPVSFEGRIVAVVLMIAGVGIFGTFSGFIASWIIGPSQKKEEIDMAHLRENLNEIRESVKKIEETLTQLTKKE